MAYTLMIESTIRRRGGKRKELPPLEYLKECLRYEPDTGKLFWNQRPREHFVSFKGFNTWNSRWANKEAGNKNLRKNGEKRYMEVGLSRGRDTGNITYSVTRVICALMEVGFHEDMEVDHKDRDIWNNKWDNLRIGTPQQNVFNRVCKKKDGLPKGVCRNGSGFSANITFTRKQKWLGYFTDPQKAHEAYCKAAKELHGEFASFDHE